MIWTGWTPRSKSTHHPHPMATIMILPMEDLIQLGNEQYHLELVLDQDLTLMRCYVLDGHVEHFIRLAQEIHCETTLSSGLKTNLVFQAIASRSTGETVGDTAEFGQTLLH